jgi:GNAT superfamily N-acetyltransferase
MRSPGVESLDSWLKRFAYTNQQSDLTTTYVVHRKNKVVGYYSLTAGSLNREDAPLRIAKGVPNHPIGVVPLARLAVHESEKGAGLGRALLKDALVRSASPPRSPQSSRSWCMPDRGSAEFLSAVRF